MLTITGKKTIAATIIVRGRRLTGPNQLIVIGANAMIGTVLAPIATGRRVSRAVRSAPQGGRRRTPATRPMAKPTTASRRREEQPAGQRVGPQGHERPAMIDGRGSRNDWMPNRTDAPSQAAITIANSAIGGSQPVRRARVAGHRGRDARRQPRPSARIRVEPGCAPVGGRSDSW